MGPFKDGNPSSASPRQTAEGNVSIILPDNRPLALPTRRGVLLGLTASFLSVPAIVRASSIMPVRRVLITETERPSAGFIQRLMYDSLASGLLRGRITTFINDGHPTLSEAERTVRYALEHGFLSTQRSAQIRLLFQDDRNGSIVEPRSLPGYTRTAADDLDTPGGSLERGRFGIRRE